MLIQYTDIHTGKRHKVRALITTDHPASSYGIPVAENLFKRREKMRINGRHDSRIIAEWNIDSIGIVYKLNDGKCYTGSYVAQGNDRYMELSDVTAQVIAYDKKYNTHYADYTGR